MATEWGNESKPATTIQSLLGSLDHASGGSRGGSQGAMDPPFQAEHCMQKQNSQQLTKVQQSLPASTPVLSVQSSYKQSLENWNLQAWLACSSWLRAGPSALARGTAQKVGVSTSKWAWLNFSRASRALFSVHVDPPL